MTKLLFAALLLSFGAHATELDPVVAAPNEIIVREDAQGNREVFKVAEKMDVKDAAAAEAVVETYVTTENKIATIVPESELDRVTSTEAWYYWNYNWYGYNWYGYNYYYRPYYTYNYGWYNYYYYRCW